MTRTIAFLAFPDFQILDVSGPVAAFEIAGRHVPGTYDIRCLAMAAGPARSSSGLSIQAEAADASLAIDTLVVSGGDGVRAAAADPALLDFVRSARPRRATSVCSGSFVLAAAGLLDGRRATTHWSRTAQFARLFPRVKLDADRIFTRDGPVWTSAGITAGIDLALALIADDLGEEIARKTARQMVVYGRRLGGQSQFSALLDLERSGGRFGPVLEWARGRLSEPLTVEDLAGQAAMSPRNFARAFLAETGVTPAKAVERLRLETARALVEAGGEAIDQVACTAGFGNPERMRRAFLRAFGQSPQALRRAAA